MYWIFKNNFYKAFEKYYDFLTYNMSDMTQWVKNLPANAGDIRDVAFIPGLGRPPLEKEIATQSSILVWEIPWTEEPGGLVYRVTKSRT